VALLSVLSKATDARGQVRATQPTRRLITQAVDRSRLAVLSGNTRPEANSDNDRGPVAGNFGMDHMQLQLRLPPEKQEELDQLTRDQQDPKSQSYHKWLTPAQFNQQFSPAPEDIEAITTWLKSEGFTVNVVNPRSIDFSGTSDAVRNAFHTEIHYLDVRGTRHTANMSDPLIPVALAPAVMGIVSLNDFKPRAMNRPRAEYTTATSLNLVVPADLATIYNLNALFAAGYSGQGETIVVVEPSDVYTTTDWNAFRDTFGLTAAYPTGALTQVHPNGTRANNCTDPGATGAEVEAIVDAEWASAAAPSANIELASCTDAATPGIFIALQNLLNSTTPPAIVSISYGESEPQMGATGNAFINALYEQGASEGVSIFVSSDDQGAAGSDRDATSATHGIAVSGFASTPYNVAVGGTDFQFVDGPMVWSETNSPTYGSALSYVPESPWDDSCANGQLANSMLARYYAGSGKFGPLDFCNTSIGEQYFLTTAAGGGGPSGCATGSPATGGIVGGTCAGYAKPTWQSLIGNPSDGVRDIPDVSLFAGNGAWGHYYVFCWSDPAYSSDGSAPCTGTPDTWSGGGGTSFSAPIMAGIQALVNQKTLEARQGNPAPIYYRLAGISYGGPNDCSFDPTLVGCIFHDIQSGDMDVNCTGSLECFYGTPAAGPNGVLSTSASADQPAFTANFGWDFATGIGSVDAYALAFNWPNSIAATSGTPQSAAILTAFGAPFVVIVKDPEGKPISNLTVTFTAPSSGASGTFVGGVNTAITNASGIATSTAFTTNGVAGFYSVRASAPSITGAANFSLSNTPGPPATITAISVPQSTAINTTFLSPVVAMVKDIAGNQLNGATVTFTVLGSTGGQGATFAGGVDTATATTFYMGEANSPALTANGIPGTYSVVASVAGVTETASFLLSNTATAAANVVVVSGTPQSTTILQAFGAPLVAKVTDRGGNPVSGAAVSFLAPGSFASGTFQDGFNADTELTNGNGVATSTTFTANTTAGNYSVFANAFTGSAPTFSMTNIAGPPAKIVPFAQLVQIAVVGTTFAFQISATVTDVGGNGLSGVPVTFSAPSSGPSANFGGSNTFTTISDLGTATTPRFTASGTSGSYNILASAAGISTAAIFPEINVDYTLAMHTPGVMQITRGTPATTRLDMASVPLNTPMPTVASLTCTLPGALTNASCSLTPPGLFEGQALAAITLTIFTKGSPASSSLGPPMKETDTAQSLLGWRYAPLIFEVALGIFIARRRARFSRRIHAYTMLALLTITAVGVQSCGGGGGSPGPSVSAPTVSPPTPPTPNTPTPLGPSVATVTATVPTNIGGQAASISKSITININVN
jgi:hypothetical protein